MDVSAGVGCSGVYDEDAREGWRAGEEEGSRVKARHGIRGEKVQTESCRLSNRRKGEMGESGVGIELDSSALTYICR